METQKGNRKLGASFLNLTFRTTRTAELSALRAGSTLPPWQYLSIRFCYKEQIS